MPIDTDRELQLAKAMSDALLANHAAAEEDPQGVLIQLLDLACQKFGFTTDEGSSRRILHLVSGEMTERRRVADILNKLLLMNSEEIGMAHRAAKRSVRPDRARQNAPA